MDDETAGKIFDKIEGIHSAMAEQNRETGEIRQSIINIEKRDRPAAPCLKDFQKKLDTKVGHKTFWTVFGTILVGFIGVGIAMIKEAVK